MDIAVLSFVNYIIFSLLAFLLWYRNIKEDRFYAYLLFFLSLYPLYQYSLYHNLQDKIKTPLEIGILFFALLAPALYLFKNNKYALVPILLTPVLLQNTKLSFAFLLLLLFLIHGKTISLVLGSLIFFSLLFSLYNNEKYISLLLLAVFIGGWCQGEFSFIK